MPTFLKGKRGVCVTHQGEIVSTSQDLWVDPVTQITAPPPECSSSRRYGIGGVSSDKSKSTLRNHDSVADLWSVPGLGPDYRIVTRRF